MRSWIRELGLLGEHREPGETRRRAIEQVDALLPEEESIERVVHGLSAVALKLLVHAEVVPLSGSKAREPSAREHRLRRQEREAEECAVPRTKKREPRPRREEVSPEIVARDDLAAYCQSVISSMFSRYSASRTPNGASRSQSTRLSLPKLTHDRGLRT